MKLRHLLLAFLAAGLCGGAALGSLKDERPKPEAAARQKFVTLLTSVRSTAKAVPSRTAKVGSLRAFAGAPPLTVVGGGRR